MRRNGESFGNVERRTDSRTSGRKHDFEMTETNKMYCCKQIVFTLLGCFVLLSSAEVRADAEGDFEQIRESVWQEIHLEFEPNDLQGLSDRRERLRELFSNVPPEFAREFSDELGQENTGGEFSRAFHGRLATAVRYEMLDYLLFLEVSIDDFDDGNAPSEQQIPTPDDEPADDLDQQDMYDTIDLAIADLDPVRRGRLSCMTSMLRDPSVDDRVILWGNICTPVVLTGCSVHFSRVNQSDLHEYVTSEEAVNRAGEILPNFMTKLRSKFEISTEFTAEEFLADNIVTVTDQIIQTNHFVEQLTGGGALGGTVAGREYEHIKSWLVTQQSNEDSVLSCFRN